MALQEISKNKSPIKFFRKRKVVDYGEQDNSFHDKTLNISREDKDDDWSISEHWESNQKNPKNTISDIIFPPIDFEEDDAMSEYEKQRLKNVEENKRMMLELGILKKNDIIDIVADKSLEKKPVRTKPAKAITPLPKKRSLRLQGKTPTGEVPIAFTPTINDTPKEDDYTKNKRRTEGELSMAEDDTCVDMLDKLRNNLSSSSGTVNVPSTSVDVERLIDDMRGLHVAKLQTKVCSNRIQSLCVHPMDSKLLVIAGSTSGNLGIWDVGSESSLAEYNPHMRPINCISVNSNTHSKLYTTSHDGTFRRADIQKGTFDLVYQTKEDTLASHLTWHCELDEHNFLVAHGNGSVGVVDQRISHENSLTWSYKCHDRSVRTVQLHPVQPQYFLTSSGIGEVKVFDIRQQKNNKGICNLVQTDSKGRFGKGMTSAFFSPDGNKVLTTCNNDRLKIYDVSNLDKPKVRHEIVHDNHTGRWLSVFKAKWHPTSSDIFFIGSMQYPKRIQIYNGSGEMMREIKSEDMTTICPVLDIHPTQSIVAGGDSVGRVYIFTTKTCADSLNL